MELEVIRLIRGDLGVKLASGASLPPEIQPTHEMLLTFVVSIGESKGVSSAELVTSGLRPCGLFSASRLSSAPGHPLVLGARNFQKEADWEPWILFFLRALKSQIGRLRDRLAEQTAAAAASEIPR